MKIKTLWAAFSFSIGAFWIAYGIYNGMEEGEWHPWYIVVLLGFVFIAWSVTDLVNERTMSIYKEVIETHKGTIKIQAEEIIVMQQRLRQWN